MEGVPETVNTPQAILFIWLSGNVEAFCVQLFEPGRRYAEPEVNLVLRQWWEDVAALRRYLVDAALLAREGGEYWRIGGPVEV